MTGRHKAIFAVATVAALVSRAAADPPAPTSTPDLTHYLHIEDPSTLTTQFGSVLPLPPGYFLDEPTFNKLNADFKALQDGNTSKDAQIKVYKAEIEKWQPGWVTLASALVGGCALGWYLHDKL